MKRIVILTIALCALLLSLAGCAKRKHRKPPLERADLTVRFFKSIREKNSELAVRQGKQLLALDPSADHIRHLISLQQSNDAIVSAQKMIDQGKINDALKLVRENSAKHSDNHTLTEAYSRLLQLRNAERLLRAMHRARNSSSMRGARIAARAGLSLNMTPKLENFLTAYEKRESALAAQEKAMTRKAEEAAKLAAEQAKLEDIKRKAEDKKFAAESAKKIAEGERVSQAAGGVD